MSNTAPAPIDEPEWTVTRTAKGPLSRYVEQIEGPKGGGTRYALKPAGYTLIERMARGGRSLDSIAKALGVSREWFRVLRRDDPGAQQALEVGRGGLSDELTDILLEQARAGAFVPAIFLAKARCGWREGEAPEGVVVNNQFNINLPSPRSRDEYLKLVTGQVVDAEPTEEGG